MTKKILFVHDFCFGYSDGKTYTAVGLPEKYFDRFIDAGFEDVEILSRYNNHNINSGFELIRNASVALSKSSIKNYLNLLNPFTIVRIINLIKRHDLIVISTPSIIGAYVWLINTFLKKKYSVEVAADYDMFSTKKFGFLATAFFRLTMPYIISGARGAAYVNFDLSKRFLNPNSLVASNVNIQNVFLRDRLCHPLIKKEVIRIGFVGGLTKRKGIRTLVNFAQILISHNIINFKIEIIGSHSDFDWAKLIDELNLNDFFIFYGILPTRDVLSKLTEFDVYIQPSFSEGLPRATIEAMSCGLPVIATTLPGFRELLQPNYLFEPGNSNILFKIFNELIISTDAYNDASQRNTELSKKFLYANLHKKRISFYKQMAVY